MSMTVTVKPHQGTGLRRIRMRSFLLNSYGTTVPNEKNTARVNSGRGVPHLALPSQTSLRLGAIHKRSTVRDRVYVLNPLYCFSRSYEPAGVRSRIF